MALPEPTAEDARTDCLLATLLDEDRTLEYLRLRRCSRRASVGVNSDGVGQFSLSSGGGLKEGEEEEGGPALSKRRF
jgi:hypothetical protein